MNRLIIGKGASGYMGALFEDNRIVEIFHEDFESISGNIYLGKVENVVKTLGGAFIDIGAGKKAFLKLKDITSLYQKEILKDKNLKSRMKILVQVKKDETKKKGPQVTTRISIPGRFLVYFPVSFAMGISKKIEGEEREKLKKFLRELREKGRGVVIRTAASGIDEEIILEEYRELKKTWKNIVKTYKRSRKVKLLYTTPTVADLILRDKVNKKIAEIITNDPDVKEKAEELIRKYRFKNTTVRYEEGDIFEKYDVYNKMKEITKRTVHLDSGAEIIIDRTEALTAIDVNTASSVKGRDQENLILKTNMEAAKEIARQLRLRNIGGIIIIDFIKMRTDENRERVIKVLKEELKKDSAKTEVFGFTNLGLLEMTRKRTSKPIEDHFLSTCPVCHGTGFVLSPKLIFSRLDSDIDKIKDVKKIRITVHQNMSGYITSGVIRKWKKKAEADVEINFSWYDPNSYDIKYYK
ncbi:MAG: Rne/Rng family ribonuclease [Thermotogaceae bacterium]|nr:Rne/Rng family ribonuclease [Thermotogaceae bacterium]